MATQVEVEEKELEVSLKQLESSVKDTEMYIARENIDSALRVLNCTSIGNNADSKEHKRALKVVFKNLDKLI